MNRLELERRKRGLNQHGLAEAILYDRTVISRLESGLIPLENVNRRLAVALERFFEMPVAQLLGPIELAESPSTPDASATD